MNDFDPGDSYYDEKAGESHKRMIKKLESQLKDKEKEGDEEAVTKIKRFIRQLKNP